MPPPAPVPLLEIQSWNWKREHSHAIVEGEVKNVSGRSLKNVAAVARIYAADDQFITSNEALLDFNPILPGQTSPFTIYATYNPAMKKASITFKELFGGTILHREK